MSAKRILLVEDDLDDIEMLTIQLKRNQVDGELVVRRDGQAALEFLERDDSRLPDLVITDVKMPRMTGLELIRRIRESPRLRGLKVVFLTSSDDARDRREAARWGAALYLRKPLEYGQFDELVDRIKTTLYAAGPRA
ncbi:MAG TPA: response regulator [Elusimicrobiota bacterium]|nr:response regulator [Elusimicrobiota bacterium]